MGDITKDFDRKEFACHCGCGKNDISTAFVERLQVLKEYLEKCERGCKYIIVNSGCRCPKHSRSVGGFKNDMHVMSRAADIHCIDNDDKTYPAEQVAAVAELFGFGGIGIITDFDVHIDDRENGGYSNNYWHGDERTGAKNCTWANHVPPAKIINKHKISVFYDGKNIFESEV